MNIFFQEQANDRLTLNGLGGDDVIDATGLEADGIQLTMNGGLGDDILIGSEGDDLINGGDGNDTALMGAGDDTFVWNPGDDNDTLEGQAGFDTMLFNGANIAENIDISANGGARALLPRHRQRHHGPQRRRGDRLQRLGGADNIVVNDLSGTDLVQSAASMSTSGSGTASATARWTGSTVNGAAGNEIITVFSSAGIIGVNGCSAPVAIFNAESGDQLVVNGGAGNDTIDASSSAARHDHAHARWRHRRRHARSALTAARLFSAGSAMMCSTAASAPTP